MGFKIGQLVIELAANTARLQQDLGKAVGMAERGAAGIKRAFSFVSAGVGGGLIGSSIINMVKSTIALGDDLNKAAIKAGLGGKAISELAYAAKLADVDLGSLSVSIRKMQIALSEAASGGKAQNEALAALGLTIDQLKAKRPDQQFEILAQQISKLKDPADRARAATELFGKAGADLLPLFEQGAAGIRKARLEAEKLGYSFSDEKLKRLADADDQVKKFAASWDAVKVNIVSGALPAVNKYLDLLKHGQSTSPLALGLLYDPTTAARTSPGRKRGGVGRPGGDPSSDSLNSPLGYAERLARAAQDAKHQAIELADVVVKSARVSGDALTNLYSTWRNEVLSTDDREIQAFNERIAKLDALRDAGKVSGAEYGRAFTEALDDVLSEVKLSDAFKKVGVASNKVAKEYADQLRGTLFAAIQEAAATGKVQWAELAQSIGNGMFPGLGSLVSPFLRKDDPNDIKIGGGRLFKTREKWFEAIFGAMNAVGSNMFGGGMAKGGNVQAGRTYLVGERGMELFRPNTSGSIVPNHALAGKPAVNLNINYVINNPDNTARLPSILRENNRRLVDSLARAGMLRN